MQLTLINLVSAARIVQLRVSAAVGMKQMLGTPLSQIYQLIVTMAKIQKSFTV